MKRVVLCRARQGASEESQMKGLPLSWMREGQLLPFQSSQFQALQWLCTKDSCDSTHCQ